MVLSKLYLLSTLTDFTYRKYLLTVQTDGTYKLCILTMHCAYYPPVEEKKMIMLRIKDIVTYRAAIAAENTDIINGLVPYRGSCI